jgi:hypothetical protein
MLIRETLDFYGKKHMKYIETLCGKNVGFLHVKYGGTFSIHWRLKG